MMKFTHGLAVIMLLLCGSESVCAAEQWALCRPAEVVAYQNRVHVRCELPVAPNIVFLATPTQPDFRFATRVVALAAVAQTSQKTLAILFDPADSTGTDFGCQMGDCRPLKAIGLTERSPPTPTTPTTATTATPATPVIPVIPVIPVTPEHAECQKACEEDLDRCIADAHGGRERGSCSAARRRCSNGCPP